MDGSGAHTGSVETRTSWVVAIVALVVLSVSYGAPLTTMVALKPIAAEFGATRSAPALAVGLTFIGAGCGGIAMGWLAERIGVRAVVIVRRHDDRHRADDCIAGRPDAALYQQLSAGRFAWRRRHVRAADDLCQPLVRRSPRHCDRADLRRPVHRGCAMAAGVPVWHRHDRLAPHHAGLCRVRRRLDPAAGGDLPARARPTRQRSSARMPDRAPASRYWVCRPIWCWRRWRSPRSAVASRCRCRWRTWLPSAAISASRPRRGRRCCRCCSVPPSSRASSGAGWRTASAACAPSCGRPRHRRRRWRGSW